MKALAGMLLAVALAMGVGSEASAQSCPKVKRNVKHVVAKKKTTKNYVCRVAKSSKSKGVMKTRTYGGYMPGTDTTTAAPREGMIDFRALGIDQFRNSEIPAREPINNGGSLQARMDGMGGLEPRTITNGMENTMAGSR